MIFVHKEKVQVCFVYTPYMFFSVSIVLAYIITSMFILYSIEGRKTDFRRTQLAAKYANQHNVLGHSVLCSGAVA